MVYMGSKRQYCKYIVPIIQKYIDKNNITLFIDCFCGGANLADKIKCQNIICNDLSPTLIALHQQAQKNFNLILTPENYTRENWDKAYNNWKKIKNNLNNQIPLEENIDMPFYDIGALEWYASFSAGGFQKGYVKQTFDKTSRKPHFEKYQNHKKQSQLHIYKNIKFKQGDYKSIMDQLSSIITKNNTLLYCDSPYKNTTPYQIQKDFNFNQYYQWLQKIGKNFPIFVSEQYLPEIFNKYLVWAKDNIKRTNGKDNNYLACEKLYLIKNFNNEE